MILDEHIERLQYARCLGEMGDSLGVAVIMLRETRDALSDGTYVEAMMRQYRAAVQAHDRGDYDTTARFGTPEEFVRGLLERVELYGATFRVLEKVL